MSGTLALTEPPISGYAHYYTSPEPSQLGAGAKDMTLNLSFEIAEDDEGIFISKAAAVWQGAIPKRAMVPLPARARAMHTGTSYVHGHAVAPPVDLIPCDGNTSHHMQICTDEVAQDASDVFQSISATLGLRSWSFEELRTECYSQSRLATGVAPRAVPPGAPSWMIIPPAFTPYKAMT
ncbi:uncharacterized protein F5891DRAFT_1188046 [Suillus fuscotomentosus]|uniref:Uncharacterized protein n=1 Tax=Suillus fuscotomentosus TaxID=1912939 RepID=A0AAD4HMJ4_9AGAM|nr:uncharacterized protein F5891DRAFT_1188046 [Suillus fuscotomentosus]KAG1900944.1 hypothetical protein F5891DRAFT_1188046 [Suillus fuscotomentosus]